MMSVAMEIAGKVALITGASEGIGAATAEELRRRGAKLALVARSGEKLAAVGGPEALRLPADVTDAGARERAVAATLDRFGRIDILINNAGVGMYVPAYRAPVDGMRAMFDLNVFAAVAMAQLAVPAMRGQGGGLIVNVSSIAGLVPLPWFTLYSGTKFALCAITDGLRTELKPHGIGAMAVCPGYVRTRFQQNVLEGKPPEALRRKYFTISAEECARAIARGIERGSRTVVTPGAGRLFVAAWRLFPGLVDRQMEKIYRTLEISHDP
jgi:short-subunit dehydrogenase